MVTETGGYIIIKYKVSENVQKLTNLTISIHKIQVLQNVS